MFQFTHPGRGATTKYLNTQSDKVVSIHAPREGCDSVWLVHCTDKQVSIHAPREGCDYIRVAEGIQRIFSFNSRTPGGVRREDAMYQARLLAFQFTHPGRGATITHTPDEVDALSFNSRTPGGVRRQRNGRQMFHTLFQFTHPGRGATVAGACARLGV